MKKILIFILLPILFLNSREIGDFVKDIKLKELNFDLPSYSKEKLNQSTEFYSKYNPKFPIAYIDFHLYSGEKILNGEKIETASLLAEVLKLGGTKSLPEEKFTEKLESLGAGISFTVEAEKIKIEISYLSRDEDLILNMLEDLIQNPFFSELALQNAKIKAIESISRRNERTESIGFRKAKELFYRGTYMGIIPQIESIQKIQMQDLKTFWEKTISQKKKVILATGKFNQTKLKSKFQSLFSEVKISEETETITEESLRKELLSFPKKNILIEKEVNQSMILMLGVLPPHNHKDFYSLQIIDYIIGGGGFNSYLMQKIRVDKGLAYSSTSYPIFKKSHGIFYAYTLTKNDSVLQVEELMKEILSEKTFEQIKETEIENAKLAIINQFVFLFSNDNSYLENELRFDEDKMPDNYLKEFRQNLQKVTLSDVKKVAHKYFDYKNLKTIIISDEKSLKKFENTSNIKITPEDSIK
jgi:predicted Zn-dependent peptidase